MKMTEKEIVKMRAELNEAYNEALKINEKIIELQQLRSALNLVFCNIEHVNRKLDEIMLTTNFDDDKEK